MALLAQTTVPERPPLAVRRESWRRGWYRFSRNPTAVAGLAITILVILIALLAPVIAPFPASAGNYVNFAAMLQPPSWPHILGTDNAGRDLLTRIMFGYRISLALVVVVLAIGVPVGVACPAGARHHRLAQTGRLHRRGPPDGRQPAAHHAARNPAQRPLGHPGQAHPRRRLRDPDRRRAELPGPGRAAAASRPGHHGRRRGQRPAQSVVGNSVPRPGHRGRRPGLQSAGRRAA